ncbi:MAG: hypothetical protein ISN26_06115 [Betaproteobacteria bacterium AqS2]|uniref:Uncharacterized protein n=1 Tax=Candidatus Amphirhobacter heronislandensis TaxID=1732024 RepID=A0A930UIP3_9GAMM|nr:hypothetical protein [Betaproteobacteria bacterium AqS2]
MMNERAGRQEDREGRGPSPEPELELHPLIILFQTGMANMRNALAELRGLPGGRKDRQED